jgi:hypothetical protein
VSEYAPVLASLERQRCALRENLARYLASAAGDPLTLFDATQFSKDVFAKARPAIVLLEPQARRYHEACHLGGYEQSSVALILNAAELARAHAAFLSFGTLLVPDLGPYSRGFIGAALDYEGAGDYAEQAFFLAHYCPPPSLICADYVRLTAPPVEELFPDVNTRSLKDEWFWSGVKAYEDWLAPLNSDRRSDGVLQIGGWPEFIQTGDSDTFLAQANLGIGDAGSLYVHLSGTTLSADIQMY